MTPSVNKLLRDRPEGSYPAGTKEEWRIHR